MISINLPVNIEEASPSERILGQKWKPMEDVLIFSTNFHKVPEEVMTMNRNPTRGEVLSTVMSIFDQLGFLAHFLNQPKMLLQEICRMGVSWDDELPEEFVPQWKCFLSTLLSLKSLEIPRCYSHTMKQTILTKYQEHL
ncbi:unnamed protein product [Allacma fusca]|uniref:Uncharacterized protein n=1 Tax=Allacma fusca TaxID=39272 RepID=A0A8J2JI53_9HEXA|nr:unnamed protein product [Allacma fusca]